MARPALRRKITNRSNSLGVNNEYSHGFPPFSKKTETSSRFPAHYRFPCGLTSRPSISSQWTSPIPALPAHDSSDGPLDEGATDVGRFLRFPGPISRRLKRSPPNRPNEDSPAKPSSPTLAPAHAPRSSASPDSPKQSAAPPTASSAHAPPTQQDPSATGLTSALCARAKSQLK